MKTKICLINQPAGLGDILLCQKIASHVVQLGYRVIWPVVDQYSYLSEYVINPNVEFCSINDEFFNKQFYSEHGVDYIQTDDFLYLPLKNADRVVSSKSMLYAKFDYCGISPENWQEHFTLSRNYERESKMLLYHNLQPGEKYNVVNRTFATPPNTINNSSIRPRNNYRTINMEVLGWDRIFDWMGVLEGAEEIHTVDTSLTLLLTKLTVKNVHIYERTNGVGANYEHPNPNYLHKVLFCDDWRYYTSLTEVGF